MSSALPWGQVACLYQFRSCHVEFPPPILSAGFHLAMEVRDPCSAPLLGSRNAIKSCLNGLGFLISLTQRRCSIGSILRSPIEVGFRTSFL